jgi:hypothetical protein
MKQEQCARLRRGKSARGWSFADYAYGSPVGRKTSKRTQLTTITLIFDGGFRVARDK